MNNITIVGNLTRDPELKFLDNGSSVAKFTLAVSRKLQSGQEEVSFINVVAFGSLGENLHDSLHKGNRAIAIGRLDQRSWTTESGEKKSVFELTAQAVGAELRWHKVDIKEGSSGAAKTAGTPFRANDEEAF